LFDFDIPSYEKSLSDAADEIAAIVQEWSSSIDDRLLLLDGVNDCVYVKRSTRVIVYANPAYKSLWANGATVTGTTGDGYLDPMTLGIAQKSDELLISSGRSVEFEHLFVRPGGDAYHVKTHKRWIRPNVRGNSILGVTRVIGRVDRPPQPQIEQLATIARQYDALESVDRTLCRLMASGQSQREIAEQLGCTTRTIENRRNRIMEKLGAHKPIEIVKIMVRLAEHGLIPADF